MDFGSKANEPVKKNNGGLRVAGIIFALIGLFFVISGVRMAIFPSTVDNGEVAEAKVVDFKTEVVSDDTGTRQTGRTHEIEIPVYEFVDKSGITHRVVSKTYSDLKKVNLGDSTTITYDASNPESKYTIASDKGLDIIPIVAYVLGGGAAMVAGIVFIRKSFA